MATIWMAVLSAMLLSSLRRRPDTSSAKEQLQTVLSAEDDSSSHEEWFLEVRLPQDGWYFGQNDVSSPTLLVQLCSMTWPEDGHT